MHKQIKKIEIAGFAVHSAADGETVKVQVKDWATSESPLFYVYAEQLANLIFPHLGIPNFRDIVNSFLCLIHPDDSADFYAQDFKVVAKIKINRPVEKGEPVYAKDITEIAELRFPDITINREDKVIFLTRSGWRFGIFFDFTKQIDADKLAKDLAVLQKELVLEDVLKSALAEIESKQAHADLESSDTSKEIYEAFIKTEGKTDRMHILKAFEELGYKRKLEYSDTEEDLGDAGLIKMCELAIHGPAQKVPLICIFDRDNPAILKRLSDQTGEKKLEYQSWGKNVFSLALPIPVNRSGYQYISIEMYYPDEVIRRTTDEGKRLFFDNELQLVKPMSGGKVVFNPILPVEDGELTKKVFSQRVEDIKDSFGRQVGLSKTAFAGLICSNKKPFDKIDFKNFQLVADIIEKIIKSGCS